MVEPAVAPIAPAIEIVLGGRFQPLPIDGVGSRQFHRLAAVKVLLVVACSIQVDKTAKVGEDGSTLIGEDIDANFAIMVDGGIAAGSVDVEGLARPQSHAVQVHRALGNAKFEVGVVEVDEGDVGVGADSEIGAAHLDLGASVPVGIDTVTGAEGKILVSLVPVVVAGLLDGDGTGDRSESACLRGWIIVSTGRCGGDGQNGCDSGCQKKVAGESKCKSVHQGPLFRHFGITFG